jgi:hypothetical protein
MIVRRSGRVRPPFGRHHRLVAVLAALLSVTALVTASPARAATGDVTITMNASDLGIAPSYLQTAVSEINAEDARENVGLSYQAEREAAEYGGTGAVAAGSADIDITASMTSDGTGVTFTIPAAEVQTSDETWWQTAIGLVLASAAGMAVRGICISGLTVSGIGAALIPLICTPAGGATTGLAQSMWQHYWGGDLGTAQAWTDILIKTVGAALAGGLWESYASPFFKTILPAYIGNFGRWLTNYVSPRFGTWFGVGASGAVSAVGEEWIEMELLLPSGVAAYDAALPAPGPLPCDVYDNDGAACTASYSTVRALFSYYDGPLYQVQRASDGETDDVGLLSTGGYVNASEQDSFCANTTCTFTKIYDQSPQENDLTLEGAGGAAGADHAADASALKITVDGDKEAYGIDFTGAVGYRDNSTTGIAANGGAEGMYMVAGGTNVNDGCCFDFGNAETSTHDTGNGHMDAVNFSTTCYFPPCTGSGPWVEADLENGLFQGGNGSNTANTGLVGDDFVTAMLKNNGQTTYSLRGGNAQSGGLSTWYDGPLPNLGGYQPMQQEGAIVLGSGGDNSNWDVGSFFEGVMTAGYPSDAADAAVQSGIVSVGYAGNSAGSGAGSGVGVTPSAAGQAVVHTAGATGASASGYSSVYTVNSANGDLQESYLPYMGDNWSTQDLSANYGTPQVMPGTQPVAVVHCGYTSVYTVDASNGDVQETYLADIGAVWATQDLSAKYGVPPTNETPTAVVHDAGATGQSATCGYTSVYTVDASNGDLQEAYLPYINAAWVTQDLSATYGAPQVQPGTSPVALVHCGYTSVYTVDGSNHDLQETYLADIGAVWATQDLSAEAGTAPTDETPTVVMHSAGASGATPGCGYTSVYTVDQNNQDLQETYLSNAGFPGNAWASQDLSAKYGTPPVAPGTSPVALVHAGYTSIYTVDQATNHLQETYLADVGAVWATQDLSAKYGTPPTAETPIVLLHPDASGDLTWTSVYTMDQSTDDLQETYLAGVNDPWVTQDLSTKYGVPPVAETQSPTAGWSVEHDGYVSEYTVDASNSHLQETYTNTSGQEATQDLSAKYGTPPVAGGSAPVAVTHDGYTSVYTIDASNGHLQETYLTALGQPWATQDLSAKYGTPAAVGTPTAVFHSGTTSVYTVNASNGHLEETYLTALGLSWVTQDMTAHYGTPQVATGTSPSAVLHSGYTSVYTVDASNGDLQETYLTAVGQPWATQDLSAKYGTPKVATGSSPAAAVHAGYTSVYTVDASNQHLQETYLTAMGDPWVTQDLSAKYGTPPVAPGIPPTALYHTGYTSVYTIDKSNNDVQETYLPAMSDAWTTQNLSAQYSIPAADQAPSTLLEDNPYPGDPTAFDIFTVDASTNDLQDSGPPAMGESWNTLDETLLFGTPPV